jgi:hypothetical protein
MRTSIRLIGKVGRCEAARRFLMDARSAKGFEADGVGTLVRETSAVNTTPGRPAVGFQSSVHRPPCFGGAGILVGQGDTGGFGDFLEFAFELVRIQSPQGQSL